MTSYEKDDGARSMCKHCGESYWRHGMTSNACPTDNYAAGNAAIAATKERLAKAFIAGPITKGEVQPAAPPVPVHHSDVYPRPPLQSEASKPFDPFKGFVVNSRDIGPDTPDPSGSLGKSFDPPGGNGQSSWPWRKW